MTADELIQALKDVDSATLADAIEGLKLRDRTVGYADLRLRCLVRQEVPMVGYAVTFTVDSTTPGPPPGHSRVDDLIDAVAASPKPCVVVAQETGPYPDRGCHMGDIIGTRVARQGAVGIVSGSGIRDLSGLRALGLWSFALGTVVSHGNWAITAVNVDVEVAGLPISPGDLLHGDEDGLLNVPVVQTEELLELVRQVRERENRVRADQS